MSKVAPSDIDRLEAAVALHQAGDIAGAARLYGGFLKDHPRDFNALRLLGVIKLQAGELDAAESLLSKSIKYNGNSADAHYFLGRVLWQKKLKERAAFCLKKCVSIEPRYESAFVVLGGIASETGRHGEAVGFFEQALAINPRTVDTWYNCATALIELRRFEDALGCLDKALALEPNHADAIRCRGRILYRLKRYDAALACFDRAIAIDPNAPDALVERGTALQNLGRHEQALDCYDVAIRIKPDHVDGFLNRAIALRSMRRHDESLACSDRAIALKADSADAHRIRAATLQQMRRYDEALACLDRAIAIGPDDTEALIARGTLLREQGELERAMEWFEKIVTSRPDLPEGHYHLGLRFFEQGRTDAAIAQFERALTIQPSYIEAELALCMAQLPVLYTTEVEIGARRAAYQQRLTELSEAVERGGRYHEFAHAVGSVQPFLLAYQGAIDRSLQDVYGSLVCRAMAATYPPLPMAGVPAAGERIRLGIVSGFFLSHSNWKIPIKGWLTQLDRREFEIFGYHTGETEDAETAKAAALCDRFVQGPMSVNRWRQTIAADAPHALIFPEVGMDRVAVQLAALRLARVQCNSWGHPETSGFSTLDYYLSSDLMEPPDGQEHYTERLVRLPSLSIFYEPPALEPISLDRAELGLRAGATVYWCGQSLYKYLPQFDQVFPRIAREAGDCQFVFIQYQSGTHVTELFKRRLEQAFDAFGLKAEDYCVLLPRLKGPRYVAAVGQADVVLDSIGWSGCNSTLESLPFDLPIVTLTSPLMRGRHSTAILAMIGVTETVADTTDDYVSIAVRLALDKSWRAAVRNRMAENKHRICCDRACVVALGEFLSKAVRRGGSER